MELAERFSQEKFYPEAIREYRLILEQFPSDLEMGRKLALSYYQNKEMDNALATANSMIEQKPDAADGHLALGYLHFFRGDHQKCYDNLSTANKLGGGSGEGTLELLYRMGYALAKLEKEEEANSIFQKVLEKDPFHRSTLWFQSLEAFRTQKWEEAERIYKLLISRYPEESLFFLELGLVYYHQSRFDISATHLRKAVELDSRFRPFAFLAETSKISEIPEKWDLASCYFNNVESGEKYSQYRENGKYVVFGELINLGIQVAKDVHVMVQYYNKNNEVVNDEDLMLNPRNIMPMQTREFRVEIPDNPEIETAKVSFNWRKSSLF